MPNKNFWKKSQSRRTPDFKKKNSITLKRCKSVFFFGVNKKQVVRVVRVVGGPGHKRCKKARVSRVSYAEKKTNTTMPIKKFWKKVNRAEHTIS
jgi:hypothetical protein